MCFCIHLFLCSIHADLCLMSWKRLHKEIQNMIHLFHLFVIGSQFCISSMQCSGVDNSYSFCHNLYYCPPKSACKQMSINYLPGNWVWQQLLKIALAGWQQLTNYRQSLIIKLWFPVIFPNNFNVEKFYKSVSFYNNTSTIVCWSTDGSQNIDS